MDIVFRVDAGSQCGVGHLMRCLALAQCLQEYHLNCGFVVREETLPYCQSRHDWVGQIIVIPSDISITEEIDWLKSENSFFEVPAIVLDGYQFDSDYREMLHKQFPLVIAFDDLQIEGKLHADIVVNGADDVTSQDYQVIAPEAEKCLGRNYRVFRREFLFSEDVAFEKRHSMTISMGGTDPCNLTIPLLQKVGEYDSDIPIRILCGSGYQHLLDLEKTISRVKNPVQLIQNCQDVADIFVHTRLAVVAAGSTQFELLQCATPGVLLAIADNQMTATCAAEKQGWCHTLDYRQCNEVEDGDVQEIIALYHDSARLNSMHERALALRCNNSTVNTVECILTQLGKVSK